MEQMVTISVKIPKSLKTKLKKSNIKLSGRVRTLLEREMLEDEARRINKEVQKNKKAFDKLSVAEVVQKIREDRERE